MAWEKIWLRSHRADAEHVPGKMDEVEGKLMTLLEWVEEGHWAKSGADTLRLIGRA